MNEWTHWGTPMPMKPIVVCTFNYYYTPQTLNRMFVFLRIDASITIVCVYVWFWLSSLFITFPLLSGELASFSSHVGTIPIDYIPNVYIGMCVTNVSMSGVFPCFAMAFQIASTKSISMWCLHLRTFDHTHTLTGRRWHVHTTNGSSNWWIAFPTISVLVFRSGQSTHSNINWIELTFIHLLLPLLLMCDETF